MRTFGKDLARGGSPDGGSGTQGKVNDGEARLSSSNKGAATNLGADVA